MFLRSKCFKKNSGFEAGVLYNYFLMMVLELTVLSLKNT